MRKRIIQLLPELGVLGVPSVPKDKKPNELSLIITSGEGTLYCETSVLNVSDTVHEHPLDKDVFHENRNEISCRTPGTLRTPDFLDDYEERAAIMEYDGGMKREDAEEAAWKECLEK